jgi:hypothetical protein
MNSATRTLARDERSQYARERDFGAFRRCLYGIEILALCG